ncbi:MAG: glycosyltransferase family 39 protein [Verrucomicrobiia bacterium]|jgi:4-amino-4-deoxy-L-arabinose transferase-like glycosyltransferase
MKQKQLLLALILIVAFGARVGYSLARGIGREPGRPSDDASFYNRYAWNLAQGNGFCGPEPGVDGEVLSTYLPPGAPALFAVVYLIFGKSYATVRIVHALLGAASAFLLFLLAKAVVTERAGYVAAAVYALYPSAIFYSDLLLTETLYTFSLILCLWLCVAWFAPRPNWTRAVICGIALGLAALVRPTIFLLMPLLALWGLFVLNGVRAKALIFVVVVVTYLTTVPWSLRNYSLYHRFILVAPRTWTEILGGNNPVVATDPKYAGYCIWYSQVPGWEHKFDGVPQIGREAIARQLAIQWLSDHPDKWWYLFRSKFIRFWSPFLHQDNRANRLLMLLSWGPVLVFFVPAFFVTLVNFLRQRHPGLLLHLFILSNLAIALIFYAMPRLRYPMEPFCIILASGTVVWLWDRTVGGPQPTKTLAT